MTRAADQGRDAGPTWLDREAGPVVRPYALTRGRSRPSSGDLDLLCFVVAAPKGPSPDEEPLPERRAILRYTRTPITVAELASRLDLALGVTRILLDDMASDGLISVWATPLGEARTDDHVLEAVIDGLRAL